MGIGQLGGNNLCIQTSVEVGCPRELNDQSLMVCLHTKFVLDL